MRSMDFFTEFLLVWDCMAACGSVAVVAGDVGTEPVLLFKPKYQLGHPENYLFSLSKDIFSGSEYPRTFLFNFENRSTGQSK